MSWPLGKIFKLKPNKIGLWNIYLSTWLLWDWMLAWLLKKPKWYTSKQCLLMPKRKQNCKLSLKNLKSCGNKNSWNQINPFDRFILDNFHFLTILMENRYARKKLCEIHLFYFMSSFWPHNFFKFSGPLCSHHFGPLFFFMWNLNIYFSNFL